MIRVGDGPGGGPARQTGSDVLASRIHELFFEHVRRLVASRVDDPQQVEDVVQDIFVNVYGSLERYDRTRDLRPWVLTIARNRLRDHWRSRRRSEVAMDEEVAEAIPDRRRSPDLRLEDEELAQRLRAALAALPETLRTAVWLRTFEGLPFREVARSLERTSAAARKRYSRALALLRQRLTSEGLAA